jgi:acyl-CoA synthetase (AMP-forming)/AMP-acid ligase II
MDPLSLLELRKDPRSPMIVTREATYTRGDVLSRASFMAGRIRESGAHGAPVILNLDAGVDFAAGLVGCWLAGSVPVLLDPLVRHELVRAVDETGAGAVIRSPGSQGMEIVTRAPVITPSCETAPLNDDSVQIDDNAPLLYLFTSGSTGAPALVPKTFENLNVEYIFLSNLLHSPDRVATLAPWCHIFGFILSFLLPVRKGGLCDLTAGISPRIVLERAAAGILDLVVAVPAIYRVMIRLLEKGQPAPSRMECRFVSSGADLPGRLRSRFEDLTGCSIVDLYGSTEAGGIAYREDDGPWLYQPHAECRILDGGHLEVRSPAVSVVSREEFYRIGDLVRPVPGGFVLDGRADDVVKIGGRRISLDEIAREVESCPGVERAAVLARPVRGELRITACVTTSGRSVTQQEIKTFVRSRMADHKVPHVVYEMERFPTTAAGKVDRRELNRLIDEGESS